MAHDRETALAPVYQDALRLRSEGHDDEAIAAALDLPVEAVPALLQLAERKRARAGA